MNSDRSRAVAFASSVSIRVHPRANAFLSGLLALLLTTTAAALDVGEAAPAFALPSRDGTTVSLAEHAGSVVLVDFWASWCGPCLQSMPFLDQLQKKLGPDGFVVLGVNLDEVREEADRFLAAHPVDFRIVFDPESRVPPAYGMRAMPSSYVVGRDGKVRAVHLGFRRDDAAKIEAEVRDALKERAVP